MAVYFYVRKVVRELKCHIAFNIEIIFILCANTGSFCLFFFGIRKVMKQIILQSIFCMTYLTNKGYSRLYIKVY